MSSPIPKSAQADVLEHYSEALNKGEPPVYFGEWLKRRRKTLDLTQAEVAEYAGCSVFALRKIESGERRPSKQLAGLIAQSLEIPPEKQATFIRVARGELNLERLPSPGPAHILAPTPTPKPLSKPNNLPVMPTPLVGREPELTSLSRLLVDPNCRLLTLVGPGGIGKTRLALEAASRQWERFAGGVHFASLAGTSSPEFMVPTIAQAVGLNFASPAEPRSQLVNYLSNKQLLLLLDNLEHLLEGVDVLVALLAGAPGVKLLVTSRERLELSGEWVFEVQGLPVPPEGQAEGLESYSAVQLFLQRARQAQVDFELPVEDCPEVARICRLVEGMPLALELAAAWICMLSCAEIACEIERGLDILATRLRDIPERQRSLRAVFDHSWTQLAEEEQQVLRQLAVFHGGFSREAAERLIGAALPVLSSLMSKSLMRRTSQGRYDLHPLIHQYVAEKLALSLDYEQLCTAHSRYYLEALQALEEDIKGRRQLEALEEIDGEIENIRAAWEWAVARNEMVTIDQGLETLYLFFEMRGRHTEGADILLLAEEKVAGEARAEWGRIIARRSILRFCCDREPCDQIEARIREALEIARQYRSAVDEARALFAFGTYYAKIQNDYAKALPFFEESLEAFQSQEDQFYVTRALAQIGVCKIATSGQDDFFQFIRRSLALAEACGNRIDANRSLHNLSSGAIALGAYGAAKDGLEKAMKLAAELGDRDRVAIITANVGLLQFLNGAFEEATFTAHRSLTMAQEMNNSLTVSYSLSLLGILAAVTGNYSSAIKFAHESRQLPSNMPGRWLGRLAVAMASCGLRDFASGWQEVRHLFHTAFRARWTAMVAWPLPVAAIILAHEEQAVRSVEVLALADTHSYSATGWMKHWPLLEEWRVRLKEGLSSERYQMAWDRGLTLELEEVVLNLLED